jgi:hypothetical protein
MGYGLEDRGSFYFKGKRFLSSPQGQDRLWYSPILISKWISGALSPEQSGRGVKLTTHLHLLLRSKMTELYLFSPTRLDGMVLI